MTEGQWEDTVSAGLWRWVDRGDGSPLPPDLWPQLEAAVRRGRALRRRRWLVRASAAAAVAAGSGAAVLALALGGPDGARPDPAASGGAPADRPGARPDTERVYYPTYGDPGLEQALATGLIRSVDASTRAGPYTVTVDGYLADFNRTIYLVTLKGPKVRQLRMAGRHEAADPWTLVVDGSPQQVTSVWDNAPFDDDVLRGRVDGPPLSAGPHRAVLRVTLPGAPSPDPWAVAFDLTPPGLAELQAREIRPPAEFRQDGVAVRIDRLLIGPTGTRISFTVIGAPQGEWSGHLHGARSGYITNLASSCRTGAGVVTCDWQSHIPVDPAEESLILHLVHGVQQPLTVRISPAGGSVEAGGASVRVSPSPESGLMGVRISPSDPGGRIQCYPDLVDSTGRRRTQRGVEVRDDGVYYLFDTRDLTPPVQMVCNAYEDSRLGPWELEIPLK